MPDLAIQEHAEFSLATILIARGAVCTLELPEPGRLTTSGALTLLWHGPRRFLAMRDGARPKLPDGLRAKLGGSAHVADASASHLVVTVSGTRAAEALGKLLPIDLHPRVFTPGSVALTRAAHIDVAIWRAADASFGLACPSSYAENFRHHLASL